MAAIARSWREDERLSKPGIVATVMSNLGLERYLAGLGLETIRTAVGDRYVLEHIAPMVIISAASNPAISSMSDYTTTRDGLVAALQLLGVVKRSDKPVSGSLPTASTPFRRFSEMCVTPAATPLGDAQVAGTIEAARKRLNGNGRLVIRPSGTGTGHPGNGRR